MDWERGFKQFVADRQALGRSEYTVAYYQRCWLEFGRFWDGTREVDRHLLREYLAHLSARVAPVTVNTWWRGIRAFLRWCVSEELIAVDPTARVKPPRVEIERKVPLVESEMARLFAAAQHPRDRAILALIMDTGARRRELCDLRTEDVDLLERCLTVRRGKNGRSRQLPISVDTVREVRRWLHTHDRVSPWLFYSLQEQTKGHQLTGNGLFQIIRSLGERSGVKAGPHLLRHSMSRSFVAQGGDIAALQALLGHSSLEVTSRYVRLNFADLTAEHTLRSPFSAVQRARGSGPKR